jgi:hypothetical protein
MLEPLVINDVVEVKPPVFWTPERLKVFELYAQGLTIKDIAETTGIKQSKITDMVVSPTFLRRYTETTEKLHSTLGHRIETVMLQAIDKLWADIEGMTDIPQKSKLDLFLKLIQISKEGKVGKAFQFNNFANSTPKDEKDLVNEFGIHDDRRSVPDTKVDKGQADQDEQESEDRV